MGSAGRNADAAATATAVGVFGALLARAALLLAYPYDWTPDEGLFFDHARRLIESPSLVYGHSVVPCPAFYGPGLATLLAPLVAAFPNPLPAGRLLALAWTAASGFSVYLLVRRRARPALAGVTAALGLLPPVMSAWHLVVRVDGLMHALWLLAALVLLPHRLERGVDRLSPGRIGWGTALLFFAALAKPTAVVCGVPLMLGWFLVDRRSAVRLVAALGCTAVVWLCVIQWLTDGGYLWSMSLWRFHRTIPGQIQGMLFYVLSVTAPSGCFRLPDS